MADGASLSPRIVRSRLKRATILVVALVAALLLLWALWPEQKTGLQEPVPQPREVVRPTSPLSPNSVPRPMIEVIRENVAPVTHRIESTSDVHGNAVPSAMDWSVHLRVEMPPIPGAHSLRALEATGDRLPQRIRAPRRDRDPRHVAMFGLGHASGPATDGQHILFRNPTIEPDGAVMFRDVLKLVPAAVSAPETAKHVSAVAMMVPMVPVDRNGADIPGYLLYCEAYSEIDRLQEPAGSTRVIQLSSRPGLNSLSFRFSPRSQVHLSVINMLLSGYLPEHFDALPRSAVTWPTLIGSGYEPAQLLGSLELDEELATLVTCNGNGALETFGLSAAYGLVTIANECTDGQWSERCLVPRNAEAVMYTTGSGLDKALILPTLAGGIELSDFATELGLSVALVDERGAPLSDAQLAGITLNCETIRSDRYAKRQLGSATYSLSARKWSWVALTRGALLLHDQALRLTARGPWYLPSHAETVAGGERTTTIVMKSNPAPWTMHIELLMLGDWDPGIPVPMRLMVSNYPAMTRVENLIVGQAVTFSGLEEHAAMEPYVEWMDISSLAFKRLVAKLYQERAAYGYLSSKRRDGKVGMRPVVKKEVDSATKTVSVLIECWAPEAIFGLKRPEGATGPEIQKKESALPAFLREHNAVFDYQTLVKEATEEYILKQ